MTPDADTNHALVERALTLLGVPHPRQCLVSRSQHGSVVHLDEKSTAADWLSTWRTLERLLRSISPEDPRAGAVLPSLARCDSAFERGDWLGFQRAASILEKKVLGMTFDDPPREK